MKTLFIVCACLMMVGFKAPNIDDEINNRCKEKYITKVIQYKKNIVKYKRLLAEEKIQMSEFIKQVKELDGVELLEFLEGRAGSFSVSSRVQEAYTTDMDYINLGTASIAVDAIGDYSFGTVTNADIK